VDIGIREAKNDLSKLIEKALNGEEVFLTKRGERVAQIVAARRATPGTRGRGIWKNRFNFYPGWDSEEEDKKIERMFEVLRTGDSE
jgi:prevent-host-death family protein